MAKERNLPSKTTLTTSDFIRVVGSDNASYKQLVSNVASVAVENAYLTPPTALSSGADLLTLAVGVYYTPSNDIATSLVNKPSGLSLNCRVEVQSRIPARRLVIVTDSANNVWENQMNSASTWTGWTLMPTRAEVDALAKNDITTSVDLASYTSTWYTFPSDGYVTASCGSASGAIAVGRVGGSSLNATFSIGGYGNNTYGSWSCFVRKGMKAQAVRLENGGTFYFRPLE